MTIRLAVPEATRRDVASVDGERSARLTCVFINNMPDGAFDSTERQFVGLLENASGGEVIDVRRYTMPGVPRGPETATRIANEYLPYDGLLVEPPDLLLVTGSNPIERDIHDEPYWQELVDVLSWARAEVPTTLLSCLSAHAATTVFDGIERTRLPAKQTGVFRHRVTPNHFLTRGLANEVQLPHSRWNSVANASLEDAGYDIVVDSDVAGWTVASREEDGHQLVLVQGHPEYDPSSLLREYRRDAGRYVRGERDDEPCLPFHCVATEDWASLEDLHAEVVLRRRDTAQFEAFDFDTYGQRAPWPWRPLALQFMANLVTSVVQERD